MTPSVCAGESGPCRPTTYVCVLCGFVYDEAAGLPADGLPAGTTWSGIAEAWTCPDCGVAKADFEQVDL